MHSKIARYRRGLFSTLTALSAVAAISVTGVAFANSSSSSSGGWSDTVDPTCGDWSPDGTDWSNGSVTFTLSNSTDTGWSGIDDAGGTCTVTTNGARCGVTISDKAGNTTVCQSPAARIDNTQPTCGSWNPASQTWTRTSVTFTLSNSTDSQSGIQTAWGSCSVSQDGANCQITIRDRVGNTRVCTSPNARIDTTPPVCEGWFMRIPPSTSFTQWNWQYDEWSIPWTKDKKTIYVTGNDTGGSGMSATQYNCPQTSDGVSTAFCTATISDRVGNTTECGWAQLSPRVRHDDTPPPKPTVNCQLADPSQPGKYNCRIIQTPSGPSPTMIYYRVGTTASWNFNGRYWFLSQNGSFVPQDTHTLEFPLNVTPGTSVTVYVKFEETGGDSYSDWYVLNAASATPTNPPVSTNPNPVTVGSQTFSYVDDTGDWYACGTSLTWPSLPFGNGTANRSSTTYCGHDGDWWSYPSWGPWTVSNWGSRACLCRDTAPPIVNTISASANGWTNVPITFTASITWPTADGSAYRGVWYGCQGQALTNSNVTSGSFTCSGDSPSAQTATIKACDLLQCTQRTITYYKETTPPTASLTVTGRIGNHQGETTLADSNSSSYTKIPSVTLNYSASDSGGSGLDVNPVKFSCSSSPSGAGTWETLGTGNRVFNVLTGPGCSGGEGSKTVYMHVRDIAGNVNSVARTIFYDTTPPNFSKESRILLLARGGYVYTVQSPSDSASGIRDYSIAWEENGELLDRSVDSSSASKNFGDVARYINANDADGKREATIRITVEDQAGNVRTDSVPVTIIAWMASFDSDSSLTPSRTPTVGDLADSYTYNVKLKDSNGNIVRPVTGLRTIGTRWEFDNRSKFLGTNSFQDGAIHYNWDGNGYASNVIGNSFYANYSSSSQKADGIYTIGVRSAVPTLQAYPDLTQNQIRLSSFRFENVLSSSSSDANGCPTGYVCTGTNANPTYTRSMGVDLVGDAGMNNYLAFKPAVEIIPTKTFNTLTDNAWYQIQFQFRNNSVNRSFTMDRYPFAFHYTNDLGPFADIRLRGDFGEMTAYPDSVKKVPFTFSAGLPTLTTWQTVTKNVEIQTNSYGYGFGKFGFSAYLPYDTSNNNRIGGVDNTGYNTHSLGLLTGITGYESSAIPLPSSSFGEGTAEWQKIAVRGSIADKGNNALTATLESGVKIDAQSIDRQKLKAQVRENAYDMARSLTPENGSNCLPVISSLSAKDVYYYDFSNLTNASPVNGNAGCYLTIQGSAVSGWANYRALAITGKKTIIIKGGNAYVDTDSYYANGDSMLAIVVLRDEKNRKKWGNILVNPTVTNVAAAAYAEGSVLSFDGNKVYESNNTYEGELTRQLHWYGSVYSSNTIWGSLTSGTSWKCPFGSDTYEATGTEACSQSEASRYDFVTLRRFVLFNATSGSCVSASRLSAKSSGTTSETYAMAGKPRCYGDEAASVAGLRKTSEKAPFVVEYNPAMQTSGMRVFSGQ